DLSFFLAQAILRNPKHERLGTCCGGLGGRRRFLVLVFGLARRLGFTFDALRRGFGLVVRLLLVRLLFGDHGFRCHGQPSSAGFRSNRRELVPPCFAASIVAVNTLG